MWNKRRSAMGPPSTPPRGQGSPMGPPSPHTGLDPPSGYPSAMGPPSHHTGLALPSGYPSAMGPPAPHTGLALPSGYPSGYPFAMGPYSPHPGLAMPSVPPSGYPSPACGSNPMASPSAHPGLGLPSVPPSGYPSPRYSEPGNGHGQEYATAPDADADAKREKGKLAKRAQRQKKAEAEQKKADNQCLLDVSMAQMRKAEAELEKAKAESEKATAEWKTAIIDEGMKQKLDMNREAQEVAKKQEKTDLKNLKSTTEKSAMKQAKVLKSSTKIIDRGTAQKLQAIEPNAVADDAVADDAVADDAVADDQKKQEEMAKQWELEPDRKKKGVLNFQRHHMAAFYRKKSYDKNIHASKVEVFKEKKKERMNHIIATRKAKRAQAIRHRRGNAPTDQPSPQDVKREMNRLTASEDKQLEIERRGRIKVMKGEPLKKYLPPNFE